MRDLIIAKILKRKIENMHQGYCGGGVCCYG